jgi:uncharacterized repeat protein (TIGR01451 family)
MGLLSKVRSVGLAVLLGATVVIGSLTVPLVAPAEAASACTSPPRPGINYSNCDLSGANFSGADLSSANLKFANLTDANLSNANLSIADLDDAILTGANLTNANLTSALVRYANLANTILSGANLTGAHLLGVLSGGITGTPTSLPTGWVLSDGYLIGADANLTNASLSGANLQSVNAQGATFTGADLNDANLTNDYLFEANFDDATFSGATLTGANLRAATATGASLQAAILTDTTLDGADFTGADFTGADLSDSLALNTTFTNATFTNADLNGTNFTDANFSGATFSGATFSGAILTNADLNGADLSSADLTNVKSGGITGTPASLPSGWTLFNGYLVGAGANLRGAKLSGADLAGANLSDADFNVASLSGADLVGTNLSDANLGDTNFTGANLTDAEIIGADLDGADLLNADLSGADFAGSNLSNATFTGTTGDATADVTGVEWDDTTCPDGTNSNDDDFTCLGHGFFSPLVLTKTTSATGYGAAGQVIPYSYLVTNTGSETLTGVAVSDNLVATVTCPAGTLGPGANENCTGSYTVSQGDVDAGSVTNTAVASASDSEGLVTSAPSSATVSATTANSSIILTKSTTSTGFGAAGQIIAYSYLVTNTGTTTLIGVGVSDDLVATVSCPAGTLAPGATEACTGSYTVSQGDVDAGSVTNTATASATNPQSTVVSSAPSSVTVAANSAISSLSLTKSTTSNGYGAAGQIIAYSYLVTNTGTTTLIGVGVSDDLVATVSCPAGTLAPGATEACTGSYTVSQGDVDAGSVTNTATASATNPHSVVITSAPSAVTVAANSAISSISLAKSTTSTGYGAAGQTIAYSYLVTNTGTVTLTGLSVADNLVATLTCPSVTLFPGTNETCTGSYTVTQGDVDAGSVTNTATTMALDFEGLVTSAPSAVTVLASSASSSISLSKSTTSTGYGAAGQTIAYSYLVTNTGTTTLSSVQVTDNANSVSCPAGTLAPEATEACTGTYTVTQGDVDAGSVTNTATASATNPHSTVVTSAPSSVTVLASNCDPPAITSADTATAVSRIPFSFTVRSCSTSVPVIKGAHLPFGVRLVDNRNGTATISGIPAARDAGIYTATITATVKSQPVATQSFALTVDNTPAFKSKATYTATTGVAFAYPITTRSGYPVPTITTPSTLPGGVTLNDTDPANGTATLGGTPDPNAGGIYVITITATNGIGAPVNQTFTLTVYQGPAITSGDSYTTVAGQPMTPFTVTATGYPVPTLKASGLPPGVKLTDNKNLTGTISGTPKSTAAGTYTVTITASSKAGTTTQTFTLLVT